MHNMYVGSVFGVSGKFGALLRFILFFLLGLLLLSSFASAATVIYTPVRTETLVWYYDTGWKNMEYEGFFLAGSRETTVAQALFEVPEFDLDSVTAVTYRVSIPRSFGIQSLSYIKIYGIAGDPAPSPYLGESQERTLLYSFQPNYKIGQLLEFDLTSAIRNAGLDLDSTNGFRVDFTAYLPGEGALPLSNPELVVSTVPEPSTPFWLLCASGILGWARFKARE